MKWIVALPLNRGERTAEEAIMHEIHELDQQEIADVAGGGDWVDTLIDGVNTTIRVIRQITGLD